MDFNSVVSSVLKRRLEGSFCYFQVTATDRDPPDVGGSISYAFVAAANERLKFSIDNRTGEIRTRHVSLFFILNKQNVVLLLGYTRMVSLIFNLSAFDVCLYSTTGF